MGRSMSATRTLPPASRWALFAVLVAAGLLYVKWLPYWDRAFTAAATHSIGGSILMGKAARAPSPSWAAALAYAAAYGKAIWKALVLGLVIGSGVQALLPAHWIRRVMGEGRWRSAVAGGLIGAPMMMCTCCAAPIVAGLRRSRASSGGAVAFWLGNTMLNPAALIFTGFVLGWRWAALRVAFGAPLVFGLGWVANRITPAGDAVKTQVAAGALTQAEGPGVAETSAPRRWLTILTRMSVQLVPEYAILVLLLGAARGWLFPTIGPEIANHLTWIIAFALVGAAFVVPTAGETPIVQAMMTLGVGAGPAAALLMTLPPISLPSMAMVWGALPKRVLAVVAASVVLVGVAAGIAAVGLGL